MLGTMLSGRGGEMACRRVFVWLTVTALALVPRSIVCPANLATPQLVAATDAVDPAQTDQTSGVTIEIIEPSQTDPMSWIFRPAIITVPVGTAVTWVNRGLQPHAVTAEDLSWDSEVFLSGQTYQRTFIEPGDVAYFCRIHPWMKATISTCDFVLGFRTLRDMIPEVVGQCLENQHFGGNGDALQQTTGGLLVWRKADNWTAFTDGYRTWLNGPFGLQSRLNTQRFSWEPDAAQYPQP
jgi:plastocyanin